MSNTILGFSEKYSKTLWEVPAWRSKCLGYISEFTSAVGTMSIPKITEDTLISYVDFLEGKGNSGSTINKKLAAISKVLQFAKRKGLIQDVCYIPRMKESEGCLRFLSEQEYKKLMDHVISPDHPFCYVELTEYLVSTGCRLSEALNQPWRDINVDTGAVHIWRNKTNKPRTVYIEPTIWYIYNSQEGLGPFTDIDGNLYRKWLKKVSQEAGVPDCTPHTLRHTCASWLVQRGIDLAIIKQWMGHSNINTTMRYAHLRPVDMKQCRDALSR